MVNALRFVLLCLIALLLVSVVVGVSRARPAGPRRLASRRLGLR
jgi:hypothetical protein